MAETFMTTYLFCACDDATLIVCLCQPGLSHQKPTTKHPVPITSSFDILIERAPSFPGQQSPSAASPFFSFPWERLRQHPFLEQDLLLSLASSEKSTLFPEARAIRLLEANLS